MPRQVAERRVSLPKLHERPPHIDKHAACSFCTTPTPEGTRHDFCPEDIHTNPGKKDDKLWECQCWKEGHPQ